MFFPLTIDEKSISDCGRKRKGDREEKQTSYLPDFTSLGQIPRDRKIEVATEFQSKAKLRGFLFSN